MRIIEPALIPDPPLRTDVYLMLQHADWSAVSAPSRLRSTAWPTERVLSVEVTHNDPNWRERVLTALEQLEGDIGVDIGNVAMSHMSVEPLSRFKAGPAVQVGVTNLVGASPAFAAAAVTSLADRFLLGVYAAADTSALDSSELPSDVLSRPVPRIEPRQTLRADVCVAGAGTGGAMAALASAKVGASVECLESLTFVGGIGAGGGVHVYWYGVAGGLQQQVDRRTRELMKRFHGGPLGDGPFNPWAKSIALEQMLREHGVELRTDALMFDVERQGNQLTAALAATSRGVLRIEANAFVDGTGDGDLCAMAGAQFSYGREHDGLSHAYSQSSGKLRELNGRPRMALINFDAGFCDPTDPRDITRARLAGIRQYLFDAYSNLSRPTYIEAYSGGSKSLSIFGVLK